MRVTHRLHGSSFWGLPCRILSKNHKKELPWSHWVGKASTRYTPPQGHPENDFCLVQFDSYGKRDRLKNSTNPAIILRSLQRNLSSSLQALDLPVRAWLLGSLLSSVVEAVEGRFIHHVVYMAAALRIFWTFWTLACQKRKGLAGIYGGIRWPA